MMSLGQVQYNEDRHRIKVGHPLYDISLIDSRNQEWEEYISKRLAKDLKNPYKDPMQPQLSRCPDRPKKACKTIDIRGSVDQGFAQSQEFRTYKTAVDCNIFGIDHECSDCVTIAKRHRNRNQNANLYDKTTPNALPGITKQELYSDYGVNYNQNYKYYDDDTM